MPAHLQAANPPPTYTTHPTCPRCRYDLSGLVASWTSACPLDATCSECGLVYPCVDILRPDRHTLAGLFEHARGPRRRLRWAWRTWRWAVRPRVFWRTVRMHHEPRPLRAAAWLVWLLLPLHILAAATHNALTFTALPRPRAMLIPPAFAPRLVAPWLPHPALGRLLDPFGSRYFWYLTTVSAALCVGLAATVLFPVLLWLLPATRRSAQISAAHVWRGAVYGCAWVVPLTVLSTVLTLLTHDVVLRNAGILISSLNWAPYRYSRLDPLIALAVFAWCARWWWVMLSEGVRLPRPRVHFLTLLVPVLLGVMLMLVLVHGDSYWMEWLLDGLGLV